MGTILVRGAIKRKPGFLYYVDGSGNLSLNIREDLRCLRSKDGSWWKKEKEINFLIKRGEEKLPDLF